MNRSKWAAVLMLFGAFAVGGASMYTYRELTERPPNRDRCQQRVERDFRKIFYTDLGFTDSQKATWDSLIDARNRAVNDVYAVPRAKADSIRASFREQQQALLTPAQRTILDERQAAIRQRQAERQKQCETQSGQKDKSTSSR